MNANSLAVAVSEALEISNTPPTVANVREILRVWKNLGGDATIRIGDAPAIARQLRANIRLNAELEARHNAALEAVVTETPAPVPVPQPRRVFHEERQYGMSKKQENFSLALARQIRDRLRSQFGEDTSATYWHKNFAIDTKLEILDELRAGRNFNVK